MTTGTVKDFLMMGAHLQRDGKNRQALKIYNQLLDQQIEDGNLYNLTAIALRDERELDEAEKYARKAVKYSENKSAYFLNTLGTICRMSENYGESEQIYDECLALDPTNAEYLNNAANNYFEQRRDSEALELYGKALKSDIKLVQAYENISAIYMRRKLFDRAYEILEQAVELGVMTQQLWETRIAASIKEQRYTNAWELLNAYREKFGNTDGYKTAKIKYYVSTEGRGPLQTHLDGLNFKKLKPSVLCVVAYGLQFLGDNNQAKSVLATLKSKHWNDLSDHQKVVCEWNYACIHLKQGDFNNGFKSYLSRIDWRDFPTEKRSFTVPRVMNRVKEFRDKTLMVCREQGVGDELMFASLIKHIVKFYKKVIFETSDKTQPLFAESFPDLEVRPIQFDRENDGMQTVFDYDEFCYVGDLPFILNYQFPESDDNSYLKADEEDAAYWAKRLDTFKGDKTLIGISWKSSNLEKDRLIHYTKLEDWIDLLAQENCMFVCLQYGDIEEPLRMLPENLRNKIFVPEIDLFEDLKGLAAIIQNCDLVLAPYTAILMQAAFQGVETVSYAITGDTYCFGLDKNVKTFCYPWFRNNTTFPFSEKNKEKIIEKVIDHIQEVTVEVGFEQEIAAYSAEPRTKDYFDQVYNEIEVNGFQTVLDVGCAGGDFFQLMPNKSIKCTGIDVSSHLIEIANQRNSNPNVSFECVDITKKHRFKKRKFELITIFGTLVTIENAKLFLDAIIDLQPKKIIINDFFNPKPLDIRCGYSRPEVANNRYNYAYNIRSIQTMTKYLESYSGYKFEFIPYNLQTHLEEQDDPTRNYHTTLGGKEILTNGLNLLLYGYFLNITSLKK